MRSPGCSGTSNPSKSFPDHVQCGTLGLSCVSGLPDLSGETSFRFQTHPEATVGSWGRLLVLAQTLVLSPTSDLFWGHQCPSAVQREVLSFLYDTGPPDGVHVQSPWLLCKARFEAASMIPMAIRVWHLPVSELRSLGRIRARGTSPEGPTLTFAATWVPRDGSGAGGRCCEQ